MDTMDARQQTDNSSNDRIIQKYIIHWASFLCMLIMPTWLQR